MNSERRGDDFSPSSGVPLGDIGRRPSEVCDDGTNMAVGPLGPPQLDGVTCSDLSDESSWCASRLSASCVAVTLNTRKFRLSVSCVSEVGNHVLAEGKILNGAISGNLANDPLGCRVGVAGG